MDALFQSHTGRPGAPQAGEVPAEQSRQPGWQDGGGGQACRGDGKWLLHVAGNEGPRCTCHPSFTPRADTPGGLKPPLREEIGVPERLGLFFPESNNASQTPDKLWS